MNLQNSACVAVMVVALAAGALTASADPGACPRDSKLLNGGPTAFGEGEGTWWGLVIGGIDDAGLTNDDQKLACLSNVFGVDFADLDEAKQFNLDLLSHGWDSNQNGYLRIFAAWHARTGRRSDFQSDALRRQ